MFGVVFQSSSTSPFVFTFTQFNLGERITESPTTVMEMVAMFKAGMGQLSSFTVITKV